MQPMRFFNTEGPVRPDDHYCIPPLERIDLDAVLRLIRDKKYFVLHAPRQTGKTSALLALRDLLNRGGDYRCVYADFEVGQAAREDTARAMRALLGELARRARVTLGDETPDALRGTALQTEGADGALVDVLSRWAGADPRPLVLLIDEIDTLIGDTLVSVLRQLRAGYDERPAGFPHSVILCGVVDVRDYRIRSSAANALVLGGSAFNIKSRSLRLGDFTGAEVQALLAQHRAETGQAFTEDALQMVRTRTRRPAVAGQRAVLRRVLRGRGGPGPRAPHHRRRHPGRPGAVDPAARHAHRPVGAQAARGTGAARDRAHPGRGGRAGVVGGGSPLPARPGADRAGRGRRPRGSPTRSTPRSFRAT